MTQSDNDAARRRMPFSGYYNRPVPNDDSFLTSVGPATPGGEYLRHYWHPFMIASELGELPVAVRLLGEDLVVFRDGSGRLGLLHRHCLHRGVSLEFGIVADRGIRCCYHGWHFDVDGTILQTPAEPPASRIRNHFSQGAYRIREAHGLLFAYMGAPESEPDFPDYDTFCFPDNVMAPFSMSVPCNWVQIVENAADPIHNAFLHAIVSGQQFSPAFKVLPELDFVETPLGFLSMATRKIDDMVFVRSGDVIMPNIAQFPTGTNTAQQESARARPALTRWAVPLDDHHSLYIGLAHLNDFSNVRSRRPQDYGVNKMPLIGQTADRPYTERQAEPGDYDAMVSPGPIANRKAEHLGVTDRGVVMFRRKLAAAIKASADGAVPEQPRLYPEGVPVRTYAHEAVVRLPHPDAVANGAELAEFGRRIAKIFIGLDDVELARRDDVARERVTALAADVGAPAAAGQDGHE